MPENFLVIVIKEMMSGKPIYIAECPLVNVASQGSTIEKAMKNLKDALISYLKSPYADKSKVKRFRR